MKHLLCVALMILLFQTGTQAQNNRLNTHGRIGWYSYTGTFKLSPKWGIHTEYQWRRDNFIQYWQQGLLRLGVNYQATPRVLLRLGYANAETYAYGEIPINGLGRAFTEHRTFQMAQLSHKEGVVELSHRFMLEQRFVGRYSSAAVLKEDEFPLWHRMRYMFRMQLPLKGKEIKDKTPYLAAYDEVLIGFGTNVNANIFDQNRLGILLGYRVNKSVRLEGGYFNQIIQFGRQINGKNVFQNNQGFVINGNFTFDVSKKS